MTKEKMFIYEKKFFFRNLILLINEHFLIFGL